MPFPARIVPKRVDLEEVFNGTQENVLQKTTVSNLCGLLNQLNKISLHASVIFTDVLQTTTNTSNRIKIARKRLHNLESKLPSVEQMFIHNAPSYFYDNPYSGKEYLRNDPLNGLLFSREDADNVVNQRRNTARPPTDLSQLDNISIAAGRGECIKQFTDSDFFINEWLENEKRKREERRQQRRKDRANRKKERVKRKQTKKIQKLKRKHWDKQGNLIENEDEPTEIAVNQQYQLTDDTNRNFDAILKKKGNKAKHGKKKQIVEQKEEKQPPPRTKIKHVHKPPPFVPHGPPPFNPLRMQQDTGSESKDSDGKQPPPVPHAMMPTPSQSISERSQAKLRGLSAEIPMGDISYEIADDALSPAEIYAKNYQKRDLDNEQLDLTSASNIIATSPMEVRPVAPRLGFLGDIAGFNKKGKLKRTEINVNRHKPKDKRTNLLDQLKNNVVHLSSVNLRKVQPKKEEKKNLIFEAMKDRRRHMEDSSEEDESDWGSDSQ